MITKKEIKYIPKENSEVIKEYNQLMYIRAKAAAILQDSDGRHTKTYRLKKADVYASSAADLEREFLPRERELETLKSRALEWIYTLPDFRTKKILELRYVKCLDWKTIENILGCSARRCQQLAADAINTLV